MPAQSTVSFRRRAAEAEKRFLRGVGKFRDEVLQAVATLRDEFGSADNRILGCWNLLGGAIPIAMPNVPVRIWAHREKDE